MSDASDPLLVAAIDTAWMIINGIIVFCMQMGFLLLECGSVNRMWRPGTVIKNLEDLLAGVVSFALIGYSFAFGDGNAFVGDASHAFLNDITEESFGFVFFQMCFVGTAATIVSGCVLDRLKNTAYSIYSLFISGIQYPIVTHWVWHSSGWLAQMGFVDFAGSGVVHMTGGISGLVLLLMLGPRTITRAKKRGYVHKALEDKTDLVLVSTGCLLLWGGWFGFNCGSTLVLASEGTPLVVGRIALNVIVAGAAAGFLASWIGRWKDNFDTGDILNGFLTGLVAITAGCHEMEPWAALICGLLATVSYLSWKSFVEWADIDDPLCVTGVHLAGGVCGVINYGIFANDVGLIFGKTEQIQVQIIGVLAILGWNFALAYISNKILQQFMVLRVGVFDVMDGMELYKLQPELALVEALEQTEHKAPLWLLFYRESLRNYDRLEDLEMLDYMIALGEFKERFFHFLTESQYGQDESVRNLRKFALQVLSRKISMLSPSSGGTVEGSAYFGRSEMTSIDDAINELQIIKEKYPKYDGEDMKWLQHTVLSLSESRGDDRQHTTGSLASSTVATQSVVKNARRAITQVYQNMLDVMLPSFKNFAINGASDLAEFNVSVSDRVAFADPETYEVEWRVLNRELTLSRQSDKSKVEM